MKKIAKVLLGVLLILVLAYGVMWLVAPQKLADFMAWAMWKGIGMDIKAVQVGDHRIVYAEGGQGEPVVLVHGFGGDKSNWVYFARYLVDSYHVIVIDLPGFGDSTRNPDASYDYPEQIARLHEFLQKLNLSKVHLVGNSMGGEISGLYAVRYPDNVASVALLDAAGVVAPHESEFNRMVAEGKNPLVCKRVEDFDRLLAFVCSKPPFIPEPLKSRMAEEAVEHSSFNEKIFPILREHFAYLEPYLGDIKAPVLIVWGREDRVIDPSSVQIFEKKIKNTHTVILEDCGHLPMTEKPKETARAYLNFMREIHGYSSNVSYP